MMGKVKKAKIVIRKELNINNELIASQMTSIIKLLQDSQQAFAWDYTNMKGLDPSLCMHKIFINSECKLVRQPQMSLNPTLKDIVKVELQKMLEAKFIQPFKYNGMNSNVGVTCL